MTNFNLVEFEKNVEKMNESRKAYDTSAEIAIEHYIEAKIPLQDAIQIIEDQICG